MPHQQAGTVYHETYSLRPLLPCNFQTTGKDWTLQPSLSSLIRDLCDSSLCEWLNVRYQPRNNNNNNNNSGGSRGRRLEQLPRAPREGHQKGESKINANLHNEKQINFETDNVNWKLSSDGPSLTGHSLEILPRAPKTIHPILNNNNNNNNHRDSQTAT